jgi:hypothetical protein
MLQLFVWNSLTLNFLLPFDALCIDWLLFTIDLGVFLSNMQMSYFSLYPGSSAIVLHRNYFLSLIKLVRCDFAFIKFYCGAFYLWIAEVFA